MNKKQYDEMVSSIDELLLDNLVDKMIFTFGHCGASLELIDLLESKGIKTVGILDNSEAKQGIEYKGAKVYYPSEINKVIDNDYEDNSIVLITSRFYASMLSQLRFLGYNGPVRKVIDYNTYAEYSLSDDTMKRMRKRVQHGEELISKYEQVYSNAFKVFFPFEALGDIYFAMSYWEHYAEVHNIKSVVFFATSNAQKDVIHMFGEYKVEVLEQKELDAMIQATIYTRDKNSLIAHQDRPYVVNLSKALYIKKIPLEQIYCCGVYGLPKETKPIKPKLNKTIYKEIDTIPEGNAVIFSPYAKSVPAISQKIWNEAVDYYKSIGKKCFTNVIGDEIPLPETEGITPSLLEMKSVVERAGTFVGIRSGLCDVIREADAKKIALYPDYNYCDTKWKAIEMYNIEQFNRNIVAEEGIEWKNL